MREQDASLLVTGGGSSIMDEGRVVPLQALALRGGSRTVKLLLQPPHVELRLLSTYC